MTAHTRSILKDNKHILNISPINISTKLELFKCESCPKPCTELATDLEQKIYTTIDFDIDSKMSTVLMNGPQVNRYLADNISSTLKLQSDAIAKAVFGQQPLERALLACTKLYYFDVADDSRVCYADYGFAKIYTAEFNVYIMTY